ncbi:alpha/beta hydrolase family protein [Actinacidiphila oryziradicis]|uniref:hypothetical protein n=1 Tax=Actinacidiphila oryziradicis TaxID=2571141 RepID=UPI001B809B4A|nr:hypothetical protein [Actinacidiphila oryziradicis]
MTIPAKYAFDPELAAVTQFPALLAGGVPVELHLFPGTFHGSSVIGDAVVSQREAAERIAVLRKALGA